MDWASYVKQIRARLGGYRENQMAAAAFLIFDPDLTTDQLAQIEQLAQNLRIVLKISNNRNIIVLAGALTEQEANFTLIDFFDSICGALQYRLRIISE